MIEPKKYFLKSFLYRSMANVAITVRRNIIKSIEVSIEDSSEDDSIEKDGGSRTRPTNNDRRQFSKPNDASKETIVGPTGVARPFISETSQNFDKQSKSLPSSPEAINPNLFKEKSVNLEMYENIRAPSKILDLRSLLINENEDNIIFDMMENSYGMFEVDQLSGKFIL